MVNNNPFNLSWAKDWTFTLLLEGGLSKVEAKGLGVIVSSYINYGESPKETADRIIFKEEKRRKSLYYSWIRSLN